MSANRQIAEAVVLRVVEFGESDLIVRLLTGDHGRLTVIAKGARRSVKRFPGTLDIFNRLKVSVRPRRGGGGMGYLEQARLLSAHLPLRQDTRRYALASYLVELLDRLSPEGGAAADTQRIFDFATASLVCLSDASPDLRLRVLLELRALDALGLRPEVSVCVRCGKPPEGPALLGFHVADGGIVCANCDTGRLEGIVPVHLGTLKVLEQGLDYDLSRLHRLGIGPAALSEAEHLLFRFHRFHIGIELRSEKFLAEALGQVPPGRP